MSARDVVELSEISPNYYKPIVPTSPFGRRVILINEKARVPVLGILMRNDGFFTHYADYPVFSPEEPRS